MWSIHADGERALLMWILAVLLPAWPVLFVHETAHAAIRRTVLHWPTFIHVPRSAIDVRSFQFLGMEWRIGRISQWRSWLTGGAVAGPWPQTDEVLRTAPRAGVFLLLLAGPLASLTTGTLLCIAAGFWPSPSSPFLASAACFPLFDAGINMLPVRQKGNYSDGLHLVIYSGNNV